MASFRVTLLEAEEMRKEHRARRLFLYKVKHGRACIWCHGTGKELEVWIRPKPYSAAFAEYVVCPRCNGTGERPEWEVKK